MDTKRRRVTLEEWNRLAFLKMVHEPHHDNGALMVEIECPHDDFTSRSPCRETLQDLGFLVQHKEETWRIVGCGACGWVGSRRLGLPHGKNGA